VHQPILRLAFRPPGQKRFKQLVNFMGATTATIMSQNDTSLTDAYRSAADEMCRSLPGKVLNFTDFPPLHGRFVGLSIETKKPSENDETGQIQLGVWDMARWKFLRRLAAGLGDDEDIFAAASPGTRAACEARLPEFLPGLVARGDEWYLVVTTQKANKTVLWRKIPLGNTADTRGIYQIVRILQYLGRWGYSLAHDSRSPTPSEFEGGKIRPLKRTRPQGHPDADVFTATTGRAPSATSASSFAAVLASGAAFSSATQQYAATKTTSRSSSPSKPAVRVSNLLDLAIPVRFDTPRVLGDAVKRDDVFRLLEALCLVAGNEGILPATLRHHADFAEPRIRPFMWAQPASAGATPDEDERILRNHEQLREFVVESTRSLALSRSEAAWNCLVHAPFFKFALRHTNSLTFEPITAAQILPAFRPVYKSSGPAFSASSASASSGNASVQSLNRSSAPVASSVHKMVDFALVLEPDEKLKSLIDAFLDGEAPATFSINQTRYEPLRKRPAPIFIETKTGSGTVDDARVQMGIWVAAWHQRMRSIISRGGGGKPVMTVPVIQVMGGQWNLFFVVDGGTEIRILDSGLNVGRFDTIVGVYQLQATMSVLASWATDVFEPWLVKILTDAVS
ncbi:hypothetical protein LLEC1_07846, partial [Akanthomyces lecanii]